MKFNIGCQLDLLRLAKDIVINSGFGINHRGQYYECLELPDMKYALVELGVNGADSTLFTGLCLPRKCSDDLVAYSVNAALKKTTLPLSVLYVNSQTQNYEFPLTWVSYLTAFIFAVLLMLLFVATIRRKDKANSKWLKCFDLVSNMSHFRIRPN